MRIDCPRCEKKAFIRTSQRISSTVRTLYCACSNVECGHTFVAQVSFSHTISPSALDLPEQVRQALPHKTSKEITALFSGLT